jgi:hypothetical protein
MLWRKMMLKEEQEQQQMRMELSRDVVFIAKHFRIILHNGKKTA